jgi:hypothetical protein
MTGPQPVPAAAYRETHSALSWPLLTLGLFLPAAAELVFIVLAIVVSPLWLIALPGLPLFLPVMIYTGLLYRNWPTGIRADESGISIGAIGSPRAARRTPTVNHQSWGLFSCPWPAVESVRVVTNPAELRQIKNSPRYYTFTNRWSGRSAMSHCNTGVLASPFMRAALIIEVDPFSVTTTPIRPARFFSNFKDGRFSRLIQPELSPAWVVPTRRPEALSQALSAIPAGRGPV